MLQYLLEHTDGTKTWTAYASYIRSLPLETARKCFNLLFERFPTTGTFVVQYCQLEERAKNYNIVVDVYLACLLFLRRCGGFFLTVRPFLSGHSTVSSSGVTGWRGKWEDSCWLHAQTLNEFTATLPKRWAFSSIRTSCGNPTDRFWIHTPERESAQMLRAS